MTCVSSRDWFVLDLVMVSKNQNNKKQSNVFLVVITV